MVAKLPQTTRQSILEIAYGNAIPTAINGGPQNAAPSGNRSLPYRLGGFGGIIVLYWSLFWILNGLDKFINGRDLFLFTWYGKNRTAQFGDYLEKTDLPGAWTSVANYAAGSWEVLVALVFLAATAHCFLDREGPRHWNGILLGLYLSAFTFIGFSVLDIIAGDRGELNEHGLYLGLVIVSWFAIVSQGHWDAAHPPEDKDRENSSETGQLTSLSRWYWPE